MQAQNTGTNGKAKGIAFLKKCKAFFAVFKFGAFEGDRQEAETDEYVIEAILDEVDLKNEGGYSRQDIIRKLKIGEPLMAIIDENDSSKRRLKVISRLGCVGYATQREDTNSGGELYCVNKVVLKAKEKTSNKLLTCIVSITYGLQEFVEDVRNPEDDLYFPNSFPTKIANGMVDVFQGDVISLYHDTYGGGRITKIESGRAKNLLPLLEVTFISSNRNYFNLEDMDKYPFLLFRISSDFIFKCSEYERIFKDYISTGSDWQYIKLRRRKPLIRLEPKVSSFSWFSREYQSMEELMDEAYRKYKSIGELMEEAYRENETRGGTSMEEPYDNDYGPDSIYDVWEEYSRYD